MSEVTPDRAFIENKHKEERQRECERAAYFKRGGVIHRHPIVARSANWHMLQTTWGRKQLATLAHKRKLRLEKMKAKK